MKEMTIHHLCVISGFATGILTNQYAGFGMVALLMEVNSIFLHTRAQLQYCNNRNTVWFKIASIGNIITNIIFRLGANYLLWRWVSHPQNHIFLGKKNKIRKTHIPKRSRIS